MAEVCSTCGLPEDLCVCEEMAKSAQPVTIEIEECRFEKEVTMVRGLDDRDIELKRLTFELKSALACGGTTHENAIDCRAITGTGSTPFFASTTLPRQH